MAPNTKRRKLLDDPKCNDPIIFQSPGLQPDTRLTVFGTEFRERSSIILQLHSNYFRRFLDSPDKAPAPATARFRYDYISAVDDDGEWGLEVLTRENKASGSKSLKEPRGQNAEKYAIECLLCAMYIQPYKIVHRTRFQDILRLADFYCALPIFSASLCGVICAEIEFTDEIANPRSCVDLLRDAKKLRNPALFREALCYVIESYEDHKDNEIFEKDKDLRLIMVEAYSGVKDRILKASLEISKSLIEDPYVEEIVKNVGKDVGIRSQSGTMLTAEYFRILSIRLQQADDYDEDSDLVRAVTKALEIKLVLDRGCYVAGTDVDGSGDKYGYLCATVQDSDLPWDADEIDW